MLLALNNAFDRRGMDLLLYLYQERETEIWYSGDGILVFAGLIGSGLVRIAETDVERRMLAMAPDVLQFRTTSHRLELTEKGQLLVIAWVEGDEKKYRELLERPAGVANTQQGESDAAR
jgi:hypothetical protein